MKFLERAFEWLLSVLIIAFFVWLAINNMNQPLHAEGTRPPVFLFF